MTLPRPLSSSDETTIEHAMVAFRDEWGFVKSFRFEDLLRQWQRFVDEVETGYALGLDDFTQELALRDSLEEVVGKLSSPYREAIEGWLKPLDQRYRFATREIGRPLLPVDSPRAFWWWRVPTALKGELLAALVSEELI